jgi:hypothetical protein
MRLINMKPNLLVKLKGTGNLNEKRSSGWHMDGTELTGPDSE